MAYQLPYLNENHMSERLKTSYRGHTSPIHPLYKTEFNNATECIVNFLNRSILAQAKYKRQAYLYNLSAEKCFNNEANNYTASESLECEKLLFKKDPVLSNMEKYISHVEVSLTDEYEKSLDGVTCSKKYYAKHKEFLLKTNFLYRYYYFFLARKIFVKSLDK